MCVILVILNSADFFNIVGYELKYVLRLECRTNDIAGFFRCFFNICLKSIQYKTVLPFEQF